MSNHLRCGALNKNGTWCTSDAVAETEWWRCLKHKQWHATASRAEKEKLAMLEIMEALRDLEPIRQEDLETRREGLRSLWS